MKRIMIFVAMLFLIAFLISYAKGQTQLVLDSSNFPKSEKEPQKNWKPSLEFSYSSKLENDAKDTIFDGGTSLTNFTVRKEHLGGITKLSTTAGYTAKRSLPDHGYFGFKAERAQHLGEHFELLIGTKFDLTRSLRYGSIFGGAAFKLGNEIEFQKPPEQRHGKEATIFTKVDYYFPIDNQVHFKRGIAWSTGIESLFETDQFVFEPSGRIIYNNGVMHSGNRILGNFEALVGYKFSRLCVGGGLDFTRRLGGEWEHNQSVIGKFFIRYN